MVPEWEVIAGRCGACQKFRKNYGGTGSVYGSCDRKPRSGAITSADYKCDAYLPIAAVAPARKERKASFDVFANPDELVERVGARARSTGRPSTRRPRRSAPTVQRRRRSDRDHEIVEIGDLGSMDRGQLKALIAEAIEDSLGISETDLLDRFVGGTVEIKPGREDTQSKEVPIDALFRKIVMIRDNLRVLEQKINQHKKLDDADRVQLQQYITRCYGSLTTFNVLFRDKADKFGG